MIIRPEQEIEYKEITEVHKLLLEVSLRLTHAAGTHDDRFWAPALVAYAAEKETLPGRSIAKSM